MDLWGVFTHATGVVAQGDGLRGIAGHLEEWAATDHAASCTFWRHGLCAIPLAYFGTQTHAIPCQAEIPHLLEVVRIARECW